MDSTKTKHMSYVIINQIKSREIINISLLQQPKK